MHFVLHFGKEVKNKNKCILFFFKLRSAKPLFLPLQIFAKPKTNDEFWLLAKNPNENETAIAIGGRAAQMLLHALCVFLCTPLFDTQWESYRCGASVREKQILKKKLIKNRK